ncbi:MAG: hypothetical protein A2Y62_12595 [Candidatus Fischerbacteria bacterium RBG_13_37_8]|uniref:Molybdopterin synthase sulfur carrier subunit n=1 Tax=Candidatus Fischerbacteria bacterium RBG_13_37_8 TaxID=1817863 RepID=A0A1F5VUK7_9BACT|nr:MAG: hypothetical protein A2Y62_12595 [Candidatus Fischerbacteria bacterium RBG_13_37_8]
MHFCGSLKNIGVNEETTLEFEESINCDELLDELEKRFPAFAKYRKYVLCAVNNEFIDDTYQFKDNDRLDILPPASGG